MVETDTLLSKEGLEILGSYKSKRRLPEGWQKAVFLVHADPRETQGMPKMDWPLFWLGDATTLNDFSYNVPADLLGKAENKVHGAASGDVRNARSPQSVLSLVDFLEEYVKKRGYQVQVEIKPFSYPTFRKINEAKTSTVKKMAMKEGELITRMMMEVLGNDISKVTVLSCSTYALKGVHRAAPSVPTLWLLVPENISQDKAHATLRRTSIISGPEIEKRIDPYKQKAKIAGILRKCRITGIHFMTPNIDPSIFDYYRNQGFMCVIGGADNTRSVNRLLTIADGISTDNYDAVLQVTHDFKKTAAHFIAPGSSGQSKQ